MPRPDVDLLRRHPGLVAVTALQALCAMYFVLDVLSEMPNFHLRPIHPLTELLAVLGLLVGSALGARELGRIMRRSDRVESRLRAASGAFVELMDESFARWALTPSEREVALLAIKGLNVAEIAALRQTQAGTVKAQCAAVYRKAGVNSRSELLSHFIEDLMSGQALVAPTNAAGSEPAPETGRRAARV